MPCYLRLRTSQLERGHHTCDSRMDLTVHLTVSLALKSTLPVQLSLTSSERRHARGSEEGSVEVDGWMSSMSSFPCRHTLSRASRRRRCDERRREAIDSSNCRTTAQGEMKSRPVNWRADSTMVGVIGRAPLDRLTVASARSSRHVTFDCRHSLERRHRLSLHDNACTAISSP
jgi:hypothetical protein